MVHVGGFNLLLETVGRTNELAQSVEVLHLTDAWHKARKQYALFSGLLIGWELVGVQLAEKPLETLNVTLRTPEVAPFDIPGVGSRSEQISSGINATCDGERSCRRALISGLATR